jgi:hypothetical protein
MSLPAHRTVARSVTTVATDSAGEGSGEPRRSLLSLSAWGASSRRGDRRRCSAARRSRDPLRGNPCATASSPQRGAPAPGIQGRGIPTPPRRSIAHRGILGLARIVEPFRLEPAPLVAAVAGTPDPEAHRSRPRRSPLGDRGRGKSPSATRRVRRPRRRRAADQASPAPAARACRGSCTSGRRRTSAGRAARNGRRRLVLLDFRDERPSADERAHDSRGLVGDAEPPQRERRAARSGTRTKHGRRRKTHRTLPRMTGNRHPHVPLPQGWTDRRSLPGPRSANSWSKVQVLIAAPMEEIRDAGEIWP